MNTQKPPEFCKKSYRHVTEKAGVTSDIFIEV